MFEFIFTTPEGTTCLMVFSWVCGISTGLMVGIKFGRTKP